MIRQAKLNDTLIVAQLAAKVWTSSTVDILIEEFHDFLLSEDSATFLCYMDNMPIGFAQCQLRQDYVEGTETSPVGYLEGVYVEPAYRKQGYGRSLVNACENWAKEKGCTEFASDCELYNTESFTFHLHLGFVEANRIICFTKQI